MVLKAKQLDYLKKCWQLTPREAEVAKLVCKGLDNDEICRELDVEYNTVRAHLGNIFRKVGVRGKAHLILEFIRTVQRRRI
jgi:DNA-binding CsgD family transcriptional regulator